MTSIHGPAVVAADEPGPAAQPPDLQLAQRISAPEVSESSNAVARVRPASGGSIWVWAMAMQLFLALPYLAGMLLTPAGSHFGGLIYNPDDPYVYLSWMRQGADGHLLFRNLFTLEPQRGVSFHILFLFLGWLAGVFRAPLIVVYHLARALLGIAFVVEAAALARLLGAKGRLKVWVTIIICTGSGLGWIYFLFSSPLVAQHDVYSLPTDLWMTETIPFLTLLLNPLFTCALVLLLGAFLCLLRGERGGSARWAAAGGACGLLLGNIHSYDILILYAVWMAFLFILTLRQRWAATCWPSWTPLGAWSRFILLIAISSPSVLYQWWVLQVEPVFHARADVATPSPPIPFYLQGIGLLLPIGISGVWRMWRNGCFAMRSALNSYSDNSDDAKDPGEAEGPILLWLCTWAVLGLALSYGPFPFQRKLAFGLDLPYLALAGFFLGCALQKKRAWTTDRMRAAAMGVVAVLFLSNGCFLSSILQLLIRNQSNVYPMAQLYIPQADWNAVQWLRDHHRAGDIVLCMPRMGNIIPSVTGDSVYVGHWGETANWSADYPPGKLQQAARFYSGQASASEMMQFLKSNHITYVYWGPGERQDVARKTPAPDPALRLPSLHLVLSSTGVASPVRIYRVE